MPCHLLYERRLFAAETLMTIQFRIPHSEFHITNLLGQTVMSGTLTDTTIDISSLPDGLYFFTIDNHTVKLMKQ